MLFEVSPQNKVTIKHITYTCIVRSEITTVHYYKNLQNWMNGSVLSPLAKCLPQLLNENFHTTRWGDLPLWLDCLDNLPNIVGHPINLDSEVQIGNASQLVIPRDEFQKILMKLHPWRKGPFSLFGIEIDSEWRSNLKWDRIADHIHSLENRLVLDVGCGNGYQCWRMLGAGAERVIGIDPSVKFVCQFLALKHFTEDNLPIDVLPIGIQDLPTNLHAFDSVFSMGVLYHRKSPLEHLQQLYNLLRPGGQIVLETLIVEGSNRYSIVPQGRYAKMRNVWFIPSVKTLISWLSRVGFIGVRLVDVSITSNGEQRKTNWMRYQSLEDFIMTDGSGRTLEGYPPPTRGVFIAEVPSQRSK